MGNLAEERKELGCKAGCDYLDHRGAYKLILAIESKFKGLADRIEALEKETRPEDPEELKESVPTDKDGKPEGGLEPGDVISYIVTDTTCKHFGKRVLGQFCRAEEKGKWLYGYWGFWDRGGLCSEPYPMLKDRVTFEFRPKLPVGDKKESKV